MYRKEDIGRGYYSGAFGVMAIVFMEAIRTELSPGTDFNGSVPLTETQPKVDVFVGVAQYIQENAAILDGATVTALHLRHGVCCGTDGMTPVFVFPERRK
jgi:hypothetical protein